MTSLLAVMDSAALILALAPDQAPVVPARLCLRSGFGCLGRVARAMGVGRHVELDIDHKFVAEILGIDHEEWQRELAAHKEFFDSLGGVVPEQLLEQREQLAARFME